MPTATEKAKAKYEAMLVQSKINNSSRKYHLCCFRWSHVFFISCTHLTTTTLIVTTRRFLSKKVN